MNCLGFMLECRTWLFVMWVGRATAVFDLVQNVTHDSSLSSKFPESTNFFDFCWSFYSHVWDWIISKKFYRESSWLFEKKWLFNSEFMFIFQLHRCVESTWTVICFIYFVISHHPNNIQLMLLPLYDPGILFIYLFILLVSWFKMYS